VVGLAVDIGGVAALGRRCLIVTSVATPGSGYDFVSRVFGPNVGIAEDPVTGSAHCALAAYWAPRLGRDDMTGYQASRRGGTVRVRLEGERVVLSGKAVTVSQVELLV
jgi:predicted PhzF superfamily epimerase YddE/YHI9